LPKNEGLQAEIDRYEIAGYRVEVLNHISAWDYILTEGYEGEVP
jgi:hypothetical protein